MACMENDSDNKPLPEGAPANFNEIAKNRHKHSFGAEGGADPVAAAKAPRKSYSIRRQLQLIAEKNWDYTKLDEQLKQHMKEAEGMTCSGARIIATRMFEKVVKKMPGDLVDKLIDNTEGKLMQKTQEIPPPKKMPEEFVTEEEAVRAHFEATQ